MTNYLAAACILLSGLGLTTTSSSAQMPTVTGSPAIADTIARLFAGIAEATTTLDLDRLLAYYEESDALTYVAQGRVTRSYDAFREVLRMQLEGLAAADLRWQDTYVDVLRSDVAMATATYAFTATLPDGRSVQTTGTYMCIYVQRDGRWRVRYSTHTFP